VGRVASLDTGRVVAVLAVLTLHARLRRQSFGGDLHGWERAAEVATDHACRFAVPFFFFVSGYLLARSTRGGPVLPRAAAGFRRAVLLYLAWSVLFLAVNPFEGAAHDWLGDGHVSRPLPTWPPPGELMIQLFQGARIQLWFLPALGTALLVVGLLDRSRPAVGLAVAVTLYAVGLAGGAYGPATGIDLGAVSRNGPFFGTLFVFLGHATGKAGGRPRLGPAVALAGAGAALQAVEVWCLHEFAGADWISPQVDYYGGTALMGVGAGRMALARPDFGAGTVWPRLGLLTLGVYLLHVDVQYLLSAVVPPRTLAWQFGLVIASYVISLALTWALARTRVGRRLVT
jgi:surface polysaccharide O-acyltransferase-like enzyme